jgi:hypothetical protein
MKVKELQDLLRKRGLPFKKLNKGAMVQALVFDDQQCDERSVSVTNGIDDIDSIDQDVQFIGNSADTDKQDCAGESEQLTALRLQLEIAKLELQKAQLYHPINVATTPLQNTAAKLD